MANMKNKTLKFSTFSLLIVIFAINTHLSYAQDQQFEFAWKLEKTAQLPYVVLHTDVSYNGVFEDGKEITEKDIALNLSQRIKHLIIENSSDGQINVQSNYAGGRDPRSLEDILQAKKDHYVRRTNFPDLSFSINKKGELNHSSIKKESEYDDLLSAVFLKLPYEKVGKTGSNKEYSVKLNDHLPLCTRVPDERKVTSLNKDLQVVSVNTYKNGKSEVLAEIKYAYNELMETEVDANSSEILTLPEEERARTIKFLKRLLGVYHCQYEAIHLFNLSLARLEAIKGFYTSRSGRSTKNILQTEPRIKQLIHLFPSKKEIPKDIISFFSRHEYYTQTVLPALTPSEYADSINKDTKAHIDYMSKLKVEAPITDVFFIEDAQFEDSLESLEKRVLKERQNFTVLNSWNNKFLLSQHRIVKGQGVIVAVREFSEGYKEAIDDEGYEKLTLYFPNFLKTGETKRTFKKSEFEGFLSSGASAWIDGGSYGKIKEGTITVNVINKDSIEIAANLKYELFGTDEHQPNQKEKVVRKTYIANKKLTKDLTSWEGKAGKHPYDESYRKNEW